MQNEKRLIDANALMKAIKGFRWFGGMPPNTLGLMFDNLRIIIKGQPTVDAVEAVHGRWEHRIPDHEVPWYWVNECSNCGFRGEIWYNYCPNCGAKMEKGE